MSRARKKPSILRRLMYLLVLVTGGGAGVGGWALQDNPRAQALWTLVTGKPADIKTAAPDESLLKNVVDVLKPADDFGRAGIYQVTINKVELDPALFKPGHTVDIQARVHSRGARTARTRFSGNPRSMESGWPSPAPMTSAPAGPTGRSRSSGTRATRSCSRFSTPSPAYSCSPGSSR